MSNLKIGIIGGGVIGLTTAVMLQKIYTNIDVTIVGENVINETTSIGAAGIFRPSPSLDFGSDDLTESIIKYSYDYYKTISQTIESCHSGVKSVCGYIFSNISQDIVRNNFLESLLSVYRPASEHELKSWKYGSYFETLLTECHTLLPWYFETFLMHGGIIERHKLTTLSDLSNFNFHAIFNCSGLGAKSLFNDRKLVPIRGQILQVPRKYMPWQDHFLYGDYDTYIIPGQKYTILGGCRNYDSYDLNGNSYDTESILERCSALEPRIADVKEFQTWVGLRPHRDPVRIEMDICTINNKETPVIHNYGHGGYGVLSAPGSTNYAVHLMKDYFRNSNQKLNCKL